MKRIVLLLLFVFVFFLNAVRAQSSETFWLLGPMFHFNIGKQFDFSVGLEVSAWGNFGSVDFGIDIYNHDRIFIYSEYQRTISAAAGESYFIVSGTSF